MQRRYLQTHHVISPDKVKVCGSKQGFCVSVCVGRVHPVRTLPCMRPHLAHLLSLFTTKWLHCCLAVYFMSACLLCCLLFAVSCKVQVAVHSSSKDVGRCSWLSSSCLYSCCISPLYSSCCLLPSLCLSSRPSITLVSVYLHISPCVGV